MRDEELFKSFQKFQPKPDAPETSGANVPQDTADDDRGFFSNVVRVAGSGVDTTSTGMRLSGDVVTGEFDENAPALISRELTRKKPRPKELVEAQQNLSRFSEDWEKADGFWESTGVVGKMLLALGQEAVTNPKGAVYFTSEQVANMVPGLLAMKTGTLVGAATGPLAPVAIPALATGGMFAGGYLVEAGLTFLNEVGEELQVRQMEPTEENVRSVLADEDFTLNSLERARRKAFGTAGVDTVMTMLGAKFAGKPGRMAHKAAISKVGVDAPVDMLKKATKEAYKAIPLRTKAARGVGGWGIDTAGEGISEGYGDFAATGSFDMGEVAMEMFGAMGTSVAEVPAVVRTLGHHAKGAAAATTEGAKETTAPATEGTTPPPTAPKKKTEDIDILAGDVPAAPKSEADEVNLLLSRRKIAEEQGVPFADEDQARLYELEVGGPLEEDRQAIQARALGAQPAVQQPPEAKMFLPAQEQAPAVVSGQQPQVAPAEGLAAPAPVVEQTPTVDLAPAQEQITREQYDSQAKLAIPTESTPKKSPKKLGPKQVPRSEDVIAQKGADMGLSDNQVGSVTKRVESLGSIDAVQKSYREKGPVAEFANWYAEKIYKGAGQSSAPAKTEADPASPKTTAVPTPTKAKGTKGTDSVTKALNEAATNRVQALGSIDAVNELYSTDTETDKLMRKIAQEIYGSGSSGKAPKKLTKKTEQKVAPVEEKKPAPTLLKRKKATLESRGPEGVKVLDRVYQSKEKEWGDNKKNPVYEAYLDVYDAVEQDGKSIDEAINGVKDQAARDSIREAVSTTLGLQAPEAKAPQKKGLKKKAEKTATPTAPEATAKKTEVEEAIKKKVESSNTTDAEIVEILRIVLSKQNATAADSVKAVGAPGKGLNMMAQAMKKLFGVHIVYTQGLHVGGLSTPLFANVIFVNLEHGHSGYYAQVSGHELLHAMEWRDPLLYRQFKHILLRFMKNTTEYMAKYNAAVRDLNESGTYVGPELNYRLAMDELIADVLGARMADPEFWAGLEKHAKNAEEKGIIRKVAGSLRALVKQIVDYFTDNREYAPSQYIDRLTEIDETLYTFLSMQTTDKTFKSDPNKKLVEKIRKAQDGKKYALRQGITGEVAPNPDNKESAARFDALSWGGKWGVTEKLAKEVVPVMMNMFGINRYHMELTIGGFEKTLVNPSVVLTFPMTTPYDLVVEAGKTLGTIWRQKSIITYNEHITTGDNVAQFVKVVPDSRMTQEQAENFFRSISHEYAPAEGMVHRDRALVFGNFSGVGKEEFLQGIANAVRKTMSGQGAILLDANFRSDYIEPVSLEGTRYENQIREVGQEEKRFVLWGNGGRYLGALWAASDSLFESSISEAEKEIRHAIGRGQREAVASPDQRGETEQRPRTRIEEALGTRKDGRIVLKHYSKEPRTVLSTHFVGHGIEGAEKKKRQNYPDLYLNPIFFAMPNLYSMEDALRSMEWEHDVSVDPKKLYDWKDDPEGIVQKAIDKVRQETGALDHSYAVATANRMIYEAGYVGLYETTDPGQQAMVILWHSVTPEVAVNVRTGERRELSKKSSIVLSSQAPAPTSSKPSVMGPKKIAQALITELKKRGHNDLASWKLYREGDPLYQHPEVKRAMQDLGFAKNALPVKSRLIKEEVEEFGYLDSQTYAEAKGLEGDFTVRYQLVSSRVPTAVGTPGDIHTTLMYTDREVFERDPNLLEKTVEVLTGYAPFSDIVGPPEEGLQKIIERVSGTLEWLYDKARPDFIDRSKKWYEGAHRVASMWADESGLSLAQTAGILAALSPQKDWHINIGLAERVIDFVTKLAATATWTKEMSQLVEGLPISEGVTKELKDQITGKAYREMEDYTQKALWLRVYDQAHNPQVTRVLTPEGNFADLYRKTNKDRTPRTLLWSTVRETAKAVSIAENGSIKNISDKIGKGNKVRNFYNNIFNPANDRFVTIDTHAVSASFMYPVKSGMTESYNLFMSPSSASTGATGTYAVIAEAHRLAASRKGIMARELQSVVWGVARSLFNQVKGQKKDKIMAIWEDFRDGKTTYETARERVYDESGGVTVLEWEAYGPDFTVDGQKPLSSYKANLPRTGLHARRDSGAVAGRVRDAGGAGVAAKNSLPNLSKPTVDQESYGQIVSRLIANENRASAWRDMLDSFVEFWQDRFLSLKRTQEALAKRGWNVPFEELPYSVLELKNSKIKSVTTKFMTEHIEPLQKAIIKSGLTMREIGLYLYARHAPSRNAYLEMINDGKKDLSGMSDQRATQILQQYQADGRAAKLAELVTLVDSLVAYERSLIRDNNLEPDNRINAWAMFVNYVPLKGLDGNNTDIDMTHSGKGINFAGSNIRRTLGREGMADPRGIVPNLVAQIMGNIVRSEEVKVQRSFLNMVRQNPDPGLWQIYKKGLNAAGKYIRTYAANPKFVSLVRERKGLEKKLKEAVSAHNINDLTQKIADIDAKLAVTPRKKVITRPDPKMAELPNVLTVTDTDGTAVYIEIMNRRLADALKNASWNTQGITIENPDYARLKDEENALAKRIKAETDPAKLADLRRDFTAVRGRLKGIPQVKVVSRPGGLFQGTVAPKLMSLMRFMSAMRTSYDPEFVISNFSKDMQTAMVHLVGEQARGLAWKVAKEVPQAISGILRARFNRRPSVYSDWYERFQSAGGEISFNEMVTAEDVQKRIEHLIDVAKPGMSLAKFREGLADRIKVVEDINSSVENGVRLAAFKNLVENGMNEAEAASIAKNLTVNFEKKGKAGTFLQMTYIFANAGIQGNARMIMSLAKSKVSRRIAAGAFSMGLMLGFMNAAIGEPDDEDETNAWDRIDDGTKGRNILVIDKNGNAYKVPMAYGYGFFVAAGYAMSEFLRGKKSVGEFASVVSASAIDNYLPVSSGPTILQTVAPTLAQPAVDLYLNKNFMGNPIYPDNPFDKRPDSQKSFGSTGIIAKWTAEQINAIFGGSKYKKSSVDEADIYPDALEHVFEFITGGPGKMLRNVAELPSTIQDISDGDWDKMGRVPFSRKVFSPVTTRYDESMFYERIRRIESLSSGIKQAQVDGNKEAANDIRRRNPEVVLTKRATALGQGIAKQRKMMKAAEARGDKATARKIKQSIVAEMKKFNSSYEKLSK